MSGARYVLLGLAAPRSSWFREISQWANASAIPAEFIKCVSAEEARVRLAGGRSYSALLVDGGLASLDRDLVETAHQAGCAVLVVGERRAGSDWSALGVNGTLDPDFDRRALLDTLAATTVMIGRSERAAGVGETEVFESWQAPLAAVCGPGGTGASTVAIALAQGLASDVRMADAVLLADFRLHAEQAMLHDAGDVGPGVQELVELFRVAEPPPEEVRALTQPVLERGYSLLPGLRRARAWSTLRPRAFGSALAALRHTFAAVVADADADLEGEDEGGSIDVEERHTMARTTLARADAVFVVLAPGMKGLHSGIRVLTELLAFGVPSERVLPILNRAPRSPRTRGEYARAFAALLPSWASEALPSPLFLGERNVEDALRDGVRLPDALCAPLAGAFRSVLDRSGGADHRPDVPQLVRPGTLGHWPVEEAGA